MSPIWRCVIAAAIALVLLVNYDHHIDFTATALDPSMRLSTEAWDGQEFTASLVPTISVAVDREEAKLNAAPGECPRFFALWLGNSQLHYINQAEDGDHVAPYWLRKAVDCPSGTIPFGFSLSNANLQEHYILERYVTRHLPIRMILLELCFDDLREDGLRNEFSDLLNKDDKLTAKDPVALDIVARARTDWGSTKPDEENAGLNGFVQKSLEDRLDAGLGSVWPVWFHRADLRENVLNDLYWVRNAALDIKATTVRKLIASRYDRNMLALEALLKLAKENNIKVVAYVAPLRQDLPIPYDRSEYEQWKAKVADMVAKNGDSFVNLEALVPADLWGSYHEEDPDFMHFRGKGHQMLAQALLPYVQAARATKP